MCYNRFEVFYVKMTIKELAKLANVSVTTVSLVLNDKPSRISDAKKEEIKKLAEIHHYEPNLTARHLVMKKSKTIGLLIPDIENLFFSALAKKVEDELRKNGYSLILVNSDDSYKNDLELIKNLTNRGVDGLLLTISNEASKHEKEYRQLLSSLSIPYVFVDRTFSNDIDPQVYFDNQQGGFDATEYLIKEGHKKIGFLAASNSMNGIYRYKGFIRALEKNNIEINPDLIFEGDYRYQSGYLAGDFFKDKKVDAIFSSNDLMAYGLIKRLKELMIRVPEDIVVVGYDHLQFTEMLGIQLPSVEQNVAELGSTAVKLLLQLLKQKPQKIKIVLEPIFKR